MTPSRFAEPLAPEPLASAEVLLSRSGYDVSPEVAQVARPCGDAVAWALLERHLLSNHTDLAVLMSAGRSRERLRARLVASPDWPEGWSATARAVFGWLWPGHPVAEARQLSFEWDCRPTPGVPFPFVSFEHAAGVATAAGRALRIAEGFAQLVDERGLNDVDRSVVECLPRAGSTLHFACLGPRGGGARRWVSGVPAREVAAFLRAVGWPGDAERVGALARRWGDEAPSVSVHLDATASGLTARLGLEVFYPGPPGVDPRWAPLMGDLLELELAHAPAVAALAKVPGERNGVTHLLDMKVVFDGERPVEGKAYLAFCPTADESPGA